MFVSSSTAAALTRNIVVLLVITISAKIPIFAADTPASTPREAAQYGHLPVAFELNRGQADEWVKFLSHGMGSAISFTPDRVIISAGVEGSLGLSFRGSKEPPQIEGMDQLPGKVNYLIGKDSSQWITQVPMFSTVRYTDVYPGINVRFHGTGSQLEYDFEVKPGADPRQIRIAFDRAAKLRLEANGDLLIRLNGMEIYQHPPRAYQETDGVRKAIAAHAVINAKNSEVTFKLAHYERDETLVIDPAIDYSAQVAGVGNSAYAVAVDASGEVFLAGSAYSTFPATTGAYQTSTGDDNCNINFVGCGDAFVMKLDSTGTSVVYATFLGGNIADQASGIAIDSSGNAYVTGFTFSTSFPVTAGAFQSTYAGGGCSNSPCANAFVTVLNAAGSALVYSTYLGGSGGSLADHGNAIAVDSSGAAYVTGVAGAPNFPTTPGSFQTTFSSCCGAPFVSKIDPTKSGIPSLVYSTFLGGNDKNDIGFGDGIAVDSSGAAYVTGQTASSTFATPGALRSTNPVGLGTGFVAKMNPSGSALEFATYLGGTGKNGAWCLDQPNAIAIDSSGNSYVTGIEGTHDFPVTSGAFQTSMPQFAETNAFVSKLNPTGTSLLYSTVMGGSANIEFLCGLPSDLGTGIAVDSAGNAYVTGQVASVDFPITDVSIEPVCTRVPTDAYCGTFLAKVNPAGNSSNSLVFSTFLGANPPPGGSTPLPIARGIGLDSAGKIYIAGMGGFQVVGGPPTTGSSFVAKIDLNGSAPAAALLPTTLSFGTVAAGTNSQLPLTLTNRGNAELAITDITATGNFFSQTSNCPASLTPSASCTITVTFAPTAMGTSSGQVSVTDSAFDTPHVATFTGTGGTVGASLSVSSLTFGDEPLNSTSAAQPVKLSSTGTAPLSITSIATTGDFAQTNDCGSSVAAGSFCTINVTFTPHTLGSDSGTLSVADNAASSPQIALLGGSGAPSLNLGIAPGTSNSVTVTAGSPANYTLVIGAGGLSGTATLSCTGAPKAATCSVPASEPVDANTATTFNVTVTTAAPNSAMLRKANELGWFWAIALVGLVFIPSPQRKRFNLRRVSWLPIVLILFLAACGGGSGGGGGSSSSGGTPSGNYMLHVTASMGSTQQTTDFTLIVK